MLLTGRPELGRNTGRAELGSKSDPAGYFSGKTVHERENRPREGSLARIKCGNLDFLGAGLESEVQRAWCSRPGALHHMEVDHGGFDAGMAKQVLDGADVGAGLQKMSGEAMT